MSNLLDRLHQLRKIMKEAENIVDWQETIYTALHNIHADWIVAGVIALARIPAHGADKHTDVTRTLYIPVGAAYIKTGTFEESAASFLHEAKGGANAEEPYVFFNFYVPSDFVSFSSLKAIWSTLATSKNMHWRFAASWAADGESINASVDSPARGVTACPGTASVIISQEPANPITFSRLAKGDHVGVAFYREGSWVIDTLDADMFLYGLLFTYTAEQ